LRYRGVMQAVVVRERGSAQIVDVATPEPRDGEVLIETEVAGLCRTDLKLIEVGHRDLVLPRVPGEEVVGTVCAAGPGVAPHHLGRRVAVYPGTSCGVCRACLRRAENLCREMRIMGFHRDGGFAGYVVAPVASVIPVPDGCLAEHAVFSEPLSCCLNALERAAIEAAETVGVWGGGPAGVLVSRAARALGAEPTVIEPHEARHRYPERVLPDPGDILFDVAVVAVGSARAYREALEHLHPRGRLVVFSGLAGPDAEHAVDLNGIHYGEKHVVGAYGCSYRHAVRALEWIHSGVVRVDDLISHRMRLDELDRALDLVRNRSGMKILLYPGKAAQPLRGEPARGCPG